MLVIVSGLSAGAAHVVSGPDHLAALAPMAVDAPRKAAGLGFRWGLGHGLGALSLGLLGVVARQAFDLHAISAWAEFLVGFALVGVGVWALYRSWRPGFHAHHGRQTFFVGMLHGVAGTGHLLAVIPSLALEPVDAVVYLLAYFISAVAVMTAFGAGLGRLVHRWPPHRLSFLVRCTAVMAIAIGVAWIGLAWPS